MNTILNFLFNHTPIFYLTQSLWRDEAFSYFMAKPPIHEIITNSAGDFNPPLYYILLHWWIQGVGKSDVGLRLFSLITFIAAVYMSYLLATVLFNRRFALFMAGFTFFNPMLLYYAFELRMYSLYTFFVFSSLYFFFTKRWGLYAAATVLGLYTHSFFVLLPASLLAHSIFTKSPKRQILRLVNPFVFFLPWIPVIVTQFHNSQQSWLYPVDLQTMISSLGNLFTGYEGTPDKLWTATAFLSAVIAYFLVKALSYRKAVAGVCFTAIALPLAVIFGYSIARRPLFVNRYLIFVTALEIVGVCLGIASIRSPTIKKVMAGAWLLVVILINIFAVPHHKKADFKSTFAEINAKAQPSDYVYAKTPIGFFESVYYYHSPQQVFIYNPNAVAIPNYIGVNTVFPNVSQAVFPPAPSTTYLVADDASYAIIRQR